MDRFHKLLGVFVRNSAHLQNDGKKLQSTT